MQSLVVEGWRGLSQSYSMVNQYQLLELAGHDVVLYHDDRPYLSPDWHPTKNGDGFDAERRRRIDAIPAPPPGLVADVVYRMDFPLRFSDCAGKRLCVFGTSEYQNLGGKIASGQFAGALQDRALTIITPSHWSKAGFVKAGFDPERIAVVPHGVDGTLFKPLTPEHRAALRRGIGLAEDDFAVLSVGAMSDNKGIDTLLLAYALLRPRYPRLRLVLKDSRASYGKTAHDVIARTTAVRPDLLNEQLRASIIVHSENMDLSELSALYGAVDCYASPYRAEGFNLPPLEAAACGVPVVVTKGGPTDDYVHESFALTVAAHTFSTGGVTTLEPDIEDLMNKLTLLMEGRAPALNTAVAVAHINRTHSWAAVARKLLDVFGF